MSGPIVRTGTTPKFWENWDKVFGDDKSTEKARKPAKKKAKAAARKKSPAKKKAAKKKKSGQ